jgi:glycogen debranching enzyme
VDGSGLVCIIHPWESGTDDSPRWLEVLEKISPADLPAFRRGDVNYVEPSERPHQIDYARFIYLIDLFRRNAYQAEALLEHSPFLVQDVLFNAILFQADEDLRLLAAEIDQPTTEIDGWLSSIRVSFTSRFWDEGQGLYFDTDLRAGKPIKVNTAATFMPLYAGLASRDQAERLIREHWMNPVEYAPTPTIPYQITSASRSEKTWEPRRYWRGPVWIVANWLLCLGMTRYGYLNLAEELRRNSLALLSRSGFREYYDPRDGSGCGSTDFSWSAALTFELAHSIIEES